MSGFDVRGFIDEYFEEHDQIFMDDLDESIGDTEDPVEIAALSDWMFRNYIADAFSAALKENNRLLLEEVRNMIEGAGKSQFPTRLMNISASLPSARTMPALPDSLKDI
ncbi:MAG: hypothetical protein MJ234_03640 [bacterium]|nr:hypothetical protein [bacterium]